MDVKELELYECPQCDDTFEDYDTALECCPPTLVTIYSCGHCSQEFGQREEMAEDCREGVDPDALPMANRIELEKAGQERLAF